MIDKKTLKEFLQLEAVADRPDISNTPTSAKSDKAIEEFSLKLNAVGNTLAKRNEKILKVQDKKKLYVMFYKFVEYQYFLGQSYADNVTGKSKPVSMQDIKKIDSTTKAYLANYLDSLKKIGVIYG